MSIFDIVVAKTFRPSTDENKGSGFYLRELLTQFRRSIDSSKYVNLDDLTLLQILAVLVKIERPDAGIENITDRYLNELKAEYIETIWSDAQKAIPQ